MRILHVLDHSLPLHSGYTFRTAAILREQRRRGWETHHLTSPRQRAQDVEESAAGLLFHRTPFRPGGWSRLPGIGPYLDEMRTTARRLRSLVVELRPDILHAHSPVLNALPALWTGREFGIPVVYEVRACWEDAAVDHGTTQEGSLRYRATRALETYALRRADAVTVICDGLRREFEGRSIDPAKITVIPNAVDVVGFAFGVPPDEALARRLGLYGATVVGFVGSFYAYEGLDLLLQAVADIAPRRPDLRVLMVGGGPEDEALRRLALELGIEQRVLFTGRVPHDEVQKYYELIDVLAYPRLPMRLTDLVTPLKPLEAMAQGRILIASDVGGHRELIHDGDTGYLFRAGTPQAVGAAIERALAERSRWSAIRASGRRFVETERTWERSVARYEAVYQRARRAVGVVGAPTAVES